MGYRWLVQLHRHSLFGNSEMNAAFWIGRPLALCCPSSLGTSRSGYFRDGYLAALRLFRAIAADTQAFQAGETAWQGLASAYFRKSYLRSFARARRASSNSHRRLGGSLNRKLPRSVHLSLLTRAEDFWGDENAKSILRRRRRARSRLAGAPSISTLHHPRRPNSRIRSSSASSPSRIVYRNCLDACAFIFSPRSRGDSHSW